MKYIKEGLEGYKGCKGMVWKGIKDGTKGVKGYERWKGMVWKGIKDGKEWCGRV